VDRSFGEADLLLANVTFFLEASVALPQFKAKEDD